MATSKAEAKKRVTSDDNANVKAFRALVESAISKYSGNQISVCPIGPRRVWEFIADEYRAAGWTVDYGDDQRDGAFFILK